MKEILSPQKDPRKRRPPLFTMSTESSLSNSSRSTRSDSADRIPPVGPSRLANPRHIARVDDSDEEGQSLSQDHRRASTTNIVNMRKHNLKAINVFPTTNPYDLDGITSVESSSSISSYNKNKDPNMIIDVLPSFEFYNTLHKHIPQGNVDPDRHDFPPTYQEVQTQRLPNISGIAPQTSELNIENSSRFRGSRPSLSSARGSSTNVLSPSSSQIFGGINLQPYSTRHYAINGNQSIPLSPSISGTTTADNANIEDDINDADNIAIDKLYTLPKFSTPLEIDIRVTKHAPKPHEKPEEESVLKEYTSGDIIHGYCVVENRSNQPLKFEMFYVTLEAYISIVDKQKGKRTIKRFLRMVDMSASWSYSNMEVSSGVVLVPGDVDYDNSIIGLSNSRVILPKTKYKKFFMFKIPDQLLDVTCRQELYPHCFLPPSLGIDKWKNNGKYSTIKVNNVLGCGHLGTKGSPILTNDMSDESLSINYTIDAKIVGKEIKTSKLNIMKEKEYNLRIVPFSFNGPNPVTSRSRSKIQLKDLKRLITERIDALERIFKRLEKKEIIQNSDIYGTDISGTIDSNVDIDAHELMERKMNQLHMHNRIDEFNSWSGLKRMSQPENLVESELRYQMKSRKLNSSTNLANSIFSGLIGSTSSNSLRSPSSNSEVKKTLENSSSHLKKHLKHSERTGIITLSAEIPTKAVKYWSPSLFRKTNKFENKNKHDQQNWVRLIDLLSEEEKTPLENIEIKLNCFESNNGPVHEPPGIQHITTELICITACSDYSIPIQMNAEILYNEEKMAVIKEEFGSFHQKINEYREKFEANIDELNVLYHGTTALSNTSRELKFSDFIPVNLQNDVESLLNLEVEVTHLHEVFRKQSFFLKHSNNDAGYFGFSLSSSDLSTASSSSTTMNTDHIKGTEEHTNDDYHHGKWNNTGNFTFERSVNVHLSLDPHMKETLAPNFETCLCARFYLVRVNIKFDHHIGTATIDIPVSVKRITT
ncbi:Ubiquitin ligase-binding protein BUL2 [Nakaseomyces bracarensis]|uniref:Ubiquitin ligase-binding protein BUL2 n=1 Tax=Nakaseomyces bracarensis TaxID=273131 RepID=A0ABR4NXN1_9SACH